MSKDEDELAKIEAELKALESLSSGSSDYGSPKPEEKDNMFKFFREIIHLPESWKVGNLKDEEIGKSELSVRSYLDLANYADAENLDIVAKYFTKKADIVAAPTMGRKGFMAQLFVTQIKKEQKLREPTPQKKGWFSRRIENADEHRTAIE